MKLLHLVNTLDPRGGGVTGAVLQLSSVLEELGHANTIATCDPPEGRWEENAQVAVIPLGPGRNAYGYAPELKQWLRKNIASYDVAMVHGLWQYHGLVAYGLCQQAKVPYCVFAHGMLDVWFKQHYPIKHLKKWLYWPWADYRILRDARAVIYTSEFERLSSRQSFWLYRCQERVVRYGITLPDLTPGEAREHFWKLAPHLRDRRLLLFLGRIHIKKGLDLLARAWSELDPVKRPELVIVGPEEEPELLSQIQQITGQEQAHYLGMLNGKAKWGALAAAEAMILPSHQENFGLVVAEALYMGTPVLISNKVNIWKEVSEGGVGRVAKDTLEGTRQLLQEWITMEDTDRQEMAARARPFCEYTFDLRKNARQLVDILQGASPNYSPDAVK